MKRSGIIAAALISVATIGAAVAIPALAHGPQEGGWMRGAQGGPGMMQGPGYGMGPGAMGGGMAGPWDDDRMQGRGWPGMMGGMGRGMMGDPEVMEHMMEMHGQMGGRMGGMGGPGGFGMMQGPGGPGMMGGLFGNLDADGDGTVTADEARAGMQAALTEYDTNGDGTLALDEFQALYDAAIHPRMVDRFQAFDADGDGQVTADEITAPADWMQQMQAIHETMVPAPEDD